MNRMLYPSLLVVLLALLTLPVIAEESKPNRFEAADSKGVTATRDDNAVYLKIDAAVTSPITIPRLCAPLREMRWMSRDPGKGLSLKPEPDAWVISWDERAEGELILQLIFDAPPLMPSEVKPTTASGDGSFYLPAHLAKTIGEKIRYEPQPYKNTVGFWVGKGDKASWMIQLEEGGRFNVAVLQGCGKGHGGSTATLRIMEPGLETPHASQDFEVQETGHWQNFRWLHLGEIELVRGGEFWLDVMPKHIKKAALMDIRAIHLIRLPEKK